LVITPAAQAAFEKADEKIIHFVSRHHGQDWGEGNEEDKAANDRAVSEGGRLLSVYRLRDGTEIWLIT
jgi:hypothetical protein